MRIMTIYIPYETKKILIKFQLGFCLLHHLLVSTPIKLLSYTPTNEFADKIKHPWMAKTFIRAICK